MFYGAGRGSRKPQWFICRDRAYICDAGQYEQRGRQLSASTHPARWECPPRSKAPFDTLHAAACYAHLQLTDSVGCVRHGLARHGLFSLNNHSKLGIFECQPPLPTILLHIHLDLRCLLCYPLTKKVGESMEDLITKIQTMTLTRTDATIAEYILEHLNTIGLLTSTSLAESIGVSDTSIIRFLRKLGFKGYSEFRMEMANRMAKQYDASQRAASLLPGEKYAQTKDRLNKDNLILDVGNYTLDNLEKSFSKLDNNTVSQIVNVLLNSKKKYIAGFRGTASCAQYMSNRLVLLLPNVIPILHADSSAIEALIDIEKDDCLFIYSFSHYSEINFHLIDIARRRGAKIILMTDCYTSPLAGKCDIVVIAKVDGLGFTNSYVAPLSISEVILLAVSSRTDAVCGQRLSMMDEIIQQGGYY